MTALFILAYVMCHRDGTIRYHLHSKKEKKTTLQFGNEIYSFASGILARDHDVYTIWKHHFGMRI
ncbi:hypothetical protein AAFF_G00170020 [Aldrovandia affinis]|uniref:Uncharacterized protein n=1 Tax=Aldrovandia affinis TaxID=143900 RepID=A0AAD7W7D1_9TELE|nr:hypothetical protein AAFF_G00170020 [Aldrovandia affinis]